MRTTVDLDTELMRAAKSRAASRGESLKEFFARAVIHELGTPTMRNPGRRIKLPLIPSKNANSVAITNGDIEEVFAAEDGEKYGNP